MFAFDVVINFALHQEFIDALVKEQRVHGEAKIYTHVGPLEIIIIIHYTICLTFNNSYYARVIHF